MVNNVKIINLPKIEDPLGNLTFIEENNHIPFDIKRVYSVKEKEKSVLKRFDFVY